MVFDLVDVSRIHQGSYMSIFRSLPAWEVLHLPCVSRASSWSLRGRGRFLRGVLVVFEDGGCTKDTSRKLHVNFQVYTLLESLPTQGGGGLELTVN